MQNEDFDAIVIAFAASVGQGAGRALTAAASEYLSSEYISLGREHQGRIDDDMHAKCCRYFRALGAAAAVRSEVDGASVVTDSHLKDAGGDLEKLALDCPLCPT